MPDDKHRLSLKAITHNLIFLSSIFNLVFIPIEALGAGSIFENESKIRNNIENKEIFIQPQLINLRAGYVDCSEDEIYFVKSISSIFFQDVAINAKISEIEFSGSSISIYLSNSSFGSGKVTYVFDKEHKKTLDSKAFNCFVNGSLSSKNIQKVYFDTESNRYHIFNNNHFKHNLITEKEAIALGAEKDAICFTQKLYIPDYKMEQSIAHDLLLSTIHMPPVLKDNKSQKRLSEIGNSVLVNWPFRKIGFKYKFVLLDSKMIGAFALPGVGIYITQGMYDSLENELELQAVLAREIAHVEKRHALSSLQNFNRDLIGKMGMGAYMLGGVGVAMATAATQDQAKTFVNSLLEGYPDEHEREAYFLAILFFKQNKLDDQSLRSAFKKVQFISLNSISNLDPSSADHHLLKERINYAEVTKFKLLGDITFKSSSKKTMGMIIKPIYLAKTPGGNFLSLYFNNAILYDKYLRDKDDNDKPIYLINVGGKSIKLELVENLETKDAFGIYRMFKYEKSSDLDISDYRQINIKPNKWDEGFYFERN